MGGTRGSLSLPLKLTAKQPRTVVPPIITTMKTCYSYRQYRKVHVEHIGISYDNFERANSTG